MSNVTNGLLDRVARRHKLPSDYALAKLLGVGRSAVSRWRMGHGQMDDEIAVNAAILAGDDPAAVLCEIQAERTKATSAKSYWIRAAELARAAA